MWQYAKMGVLWLGIKEIIRCILHGRSLKAVYPVVTKLVDQELVNQYDTQSEIATIREHGSLRYGASAYDNEDKVQGTKYKVQECKNLLNQRGARLELFKKLGLKEFAGAVMYVMREVFAMPEERMLCRPDEKRGRKLLEEIMIGGNFGKFDERYNWAETTNGSMDYRGASYAFARLRHNFQFLRDYPSEVLWEPVFRVYHWVWRKFRLWRFE